jgi:RHS repeat-associated protein
MSRRRDLSLDLTVTPHSRKARSLQGLRKPLALLVSVASSLTGVFILTPTVVAHADTAQRTSWNAVSKELYRLEGDTSSSNPPPWEPMDPSKLVLAVTPAVNSTAVLSSFVDVESSTTLNTEVGIAINGVVVAWKDGGEYTGSSPDPVYVQEPYGMNAGTTYSLELMWRPATSEPAGVFLEAGDPVPPDGPGFSPTTLNALLTPTSDGFVASKVSSGTSQFSTTSTAWTLMDSSVETSFMTPAGSGNYSTLLTASADLYSSSSAWTNADIAICIAASTAINSTCTSAGASIIGAQTSGSVAGGMPIAALVEATQTLAPNTTYTMGIFWQAEAAHTIYAGAGTSGAYSLTSLIAQMTPSSDSEQSTISTTSVQTRSYSGSDNGTNWETIGSDTYSITPSVSVLTYLTANATLAINTGTDPIDFGICVASGSNTCDTTGANIAAETASRVAPPAPDAAYLQIPVFMTAGTPYTVALQWRAGDAMTTGESMVAGKSISGTLWPTDESTLTSLQVPYSAPSAPGSASATASNGQATVSWTASTLSPGSPLTGYAVTPWLQTTSGGVELQSMDVGLVTSFTVPNLANGQSYVFTVAGLNAVGAGATASSGTVTPGLPGAPTGVTIGSRGNGFENVSWTAPASSGASAITGYLITPYIAGVAQTATTQWGTATSASITGLTDGTNYTFGVAAINVFGTGAAGTSGSNNPYKTVPGVPTGVSGAAGNAQATISWTAPANNGGAAITSYTITPYIGGTAQSASSASASPATVTGLTNGTTYTFTVAAVNSVGTGTASANSWAVIPATTPVVPSMTVTVDKGTSATYAIGTAVTYTATISSNAGAAVTASFTDALPSGVSGAGGSILVNGSACTGGVTCTATASTITVSGLTIPATGNVVVTYALTVVGSLRSCALESDSAAVTIASGNSVGTSAPFTACDSDLGTNAWNSFITQTLGDGGSAGINPANGNLVVTQTDSIPMQLHGGLSFDLTRTYNSQDTDLAGVPNIVGAGWIVSFVDAGTDPAGVALIAPSAVSYANTMPITLVDGGGARYVFTPSALSSVINVGSLSATGPLATAIPNNLPKTTGYNQRCIDEEYNAPAGVHVAMWRYVETTGTCATLATSTNLILGYVTVGADRIRHEYNALGELINLNDAVGNQVNYTYNGSNQLTAVTEQGGSARKFAISYSSTIKITDAGGEKTTYTDTSGNLTSVANPDGTSLSYTYGGCTGASSTQLCSATDGRGHATDFTYTASAAGPASVATFVDRNGNTTTITYNSTNVTADRSGERTAYASIDGSGRVGEVDSGSTANVWLSRTFYGWDTATAGCRQPDAGVDNDLCSIIRRGLTPSAGPLGAPDRVTYYVYGDEGQTLSERDLDYPTDVYTTAGYQEEYFEVGATVSTYTDSVAGSGNVTSTTQTGGRKDSGTLFDVITQTQALTPRGNAAGSGYSTYLTTYLVDNNTSVSTNTANSATSLCGSPSSPIANTGLQCEIEAPSFDGTHVTQTNYTYNPDGTRATMTTPKENAESLGNQYVYTYYQNTDDDLSGTTSAGGWLKGITDPTGNFTTFAYDAEGQQVRSWDRNATSADGVALSSANWNSLSSAPADYTESLYTNGLDTVASTFSAPGRYVLASRTQLAEWTTDTVDANGNVIGTRKPNAPSAGPTSTPVCPQPTTGQTFDTCRTYDNNDNLLTTLAPMEANTANYGSQKFTTYRYDAFDDEIGVTDPNGNVDATVYDTLNRPTMKLWTMATWGAMPTPPGCEDSPSSNIPYSWFPSGEITCFSTTTHDGVGNATSSTDGTGNTSYTLFDADQRAVVSTSPRYDATFANLVTVTLYNPDGQVTDVCSPRELAEGAADSYVCNSASTFGTHTTYNAAGWVATAYTYQVAGTPDTTTYSYDADGNKTTVENANLDPTTYVYTVLDRMYSMTVPRSSMAAYTTNYTYDPSGSLTEEDQPIDGTNWIRTEYTYDADHRVVEKITGASASNSVAPYSATGGTDVRTKNVYDDDGNVVAQYQPNAFATSGTTGDPDYETGAAYNADDEKTAVYAPRYDAGTHSPSLTDLTANATQTAECPEGGVSGFSYPSTLGICTTSYAYDPDGNTVTVNWPTQTSTDRNPVTTYSYTNTNLVLTETDPNPNTTTGGTVAAETYAYDAEGQETDETDANLVSTQTLYTADERVASTTQTPSATATHVTTYLYDAAGEQTQMIDALGYSTQSTYYANGLTKSVTDAAGDETSYVYDAVGNPTAVYSPDANAEAAANPNGTPTYNVYTEDNLLEATLIPVNSTDTQRAVCYAYDRSGRKTGQGNWLNTGSVISTEPSTCGGGVPSGSFTFTNLPDGRLAAELGRNGTSTLSYTYDADGNQLMSKDSTDSVTTTDTYYADDLVRTAADGTASPRTTEYAYDGAGNVTGRNSVQTGGTTYTDTITYNDADLQASEYTSSTPTSPIVWSYDKGGRLAYMEEAGAYNYYTYAADGTLDLEEMLSSLAPYDAFTYFTQTLDGDFQVTSDGCTQCFNTNGTAYVGHTFTYQYDPAGRLIFIEASGGSAAFQTYDQDGNRISHDDVVTDVTTSYTYNADNSIATTIMGGTSLPATYDTTHGSGVMTGDGCQTWTLDTFDRASAVAPVSSPPSGCPSVTSTTYKFDANGKTVSETASGTTTTIHDDGTSSTPIVESTGSTNTVYFLDGAGTAVAETGSTGFVYLVDDPKGDLSTLVESNGNWPTCQMQYDPYGTVVFGASATNPCETGSSTEDLHYQNQRQDSANATYQLGWRTYDPTKNSFLTPDHYQMGTPVQDLALEVDPITENTYAFVDGDPVNRFDPTGHMYTCGNDCPTGGADHTATIQQKTYSYYKTHPKEADRQQAVDDRLRTAIDKQEEAAGFAVTQKAAAPQTCGSFWCGLSQGLWGTLSAVGSIMNPGAAQLINEGLDTKDNPWLAGGCENGEDWCLAGQITGFAAPALLAPEAGAEDAAGALADGATDAAGAFPAFTQTSASVAFKSGTFQDAAISDIARALRAGTVSPSDLPINVLDRGQGLLGFDTRSMLALRQANIPLSDWTLIDQTGNPTFESALSNRLTANGLTNAGTDTLRITGLGRSASWWDGAP